MLDFEFATHEEICAEIGRRLKSQRLAQNLLQKDLAARAGVSPGTIKNLESKGQASLESWTRIVMALGLADELVPLFALKQTSIRQLEQVQAASVRKRASRSVR
jgi:transcriptional regulator with XRE-family HTH domain